MFWVGVISAGGPAINSGRSFLTSSLGLDWNLETKMLCPHRKLYPLSRVCTENRNLFREISVKFRSISENRFAKFRIISEKIRIFCIPKFSNFFFKGTVHELFKFCEISVWSRIYCEGLKNSSTGIAENDRNFTKLSASEIMQNFAKRWLKLSETFCEISDIPKF